MSSFYEDFKKKKEQNSSKSAKASDVVKVTPTRAVNKQTQTVTKTLPKATKVTTSKQTAQKKAQQQRERAAALGLDSSDLSPLSLLKRDAATNTTTKDKITYAKTSGLAGKRSAAEIADWKKKGSEEAAARNKKNAAQTLSKWDRKLSSREQNLIRDAKTSYDEAREKGDRAGMEAAHKRAESTRKDRGYSGGVTGEEYRSPELSFEEKVLLNQDGRERLKMAKMNLEAARASGNENGIAAAERAVKRILETDAFRNEGTKKLSGFVTGHGQTVDRKSMTLEEFKDSEKKFNEGLYSAMAAVPGSILSLVETSNKAIENSIREKNRDYIDRKANELDSLRARLALAKRGEGNPAWGTVEQLEQRIKIAENLEKLRSSGRTVDPNLPGQTLMRKSAESRQKFMEGRTGVDRLLASAGLSMAQMVPALAASAIPGVGPAVGAGIMGAQAAGSKAYELNERGVSPAEAQMRGIVSGGIEALTEKIPISNLLKVVKAGGGASLIKTMAKQAGIEATEESVSYALNYAADVAAKDPEAKFSMNDLLESAAVGAISGGTLGGVGSVVGSKLSYGQAQDTAQPSRLERIGQQALMKASGLKDRLSPPAETTQTTPEQVPTQAVEEHSAQEERTEQAAETPRERFNRRYQDVMARIQAAVDDPAQQTADGYAALSSELQTIMEEGNRLTQQERQEAGQVSRNFGEAESHIDNRTPEEMGSRSVKAFQFDHPQLHQYFVQAAEALKRDAAYSFETQRSERGNGTVVRRSEQLERAEGMGLTRNEIIRVCDDIIADNGQENYAAAKRVELILDDMLSRGYIPNEGTTEADTKIPANEAYIQAKNQIPGAVTGFDRYKRDNSLSLELGEVTEEELKAEYDSKHETDQDSLTAILRANLPALSDMVEVATVTGDEIPSFGKATDRIMSFVKSLGGKVSRDGFGDVLFSRSKIKNSFLGHGVGEGKIRLFAAVPAVIRNGEQIGYSSNWKGRGYDTYTFAAPVDYFGDTVYVAAIVAKDNLSNRYYLHEAVDQNGELLYGNEKNQMQPSDRLTGDPQGTVATPDSMNRVAQNASDVNENTMPEGMGAASRGFDPYTHTINEYGAIEPGEYPARIVDVPQSTDGQNRVRRWARTAMEAEATTEDTIRALERNIINNGFSYKVKKDKESLERAVSVIENYGLDPALAQWQEVVDGRRSASKDDIVLAETLYINAERTGNRELAQKLAAEIAAEGTRMGQGVQALRLLKKATKEGKVYYIRKSVEYVKQELRGRMGDRAQNIILDDALVQDFMNAQGKTEEDAALDAIYGSVAKQIPPTLNDRITAWRYFAMLGNPRTHIKNIVGNVIFGSVLKGSNKVSALIQRAALAQDQRTRSVFTDQAAKDFAKQDFEEMKTTLSGDKYDSAYTEIQRRVQNNSLGIFNKPAQLSSNAMNTEDMWAKKSAYIRSMAEFITAKGWDANNLTNEQVETARTQAVKDAQRATFQEASDLAKTLTQLEKKGPAWNLAIGGIMPFKGVPINIAKHGFNLSPAGLLKSLSYDLYKVKKGERTAAEAIDHISQGLTGTSIAAVGAFLAAQGILLSGGSDDEKERLLEASQGSQEYALRLGDYTYTIDWAAPAVLPLFVGAEMWNTIKGERDDDTGVLEASFDALIRLFEPMMNMTVLSGISDTIRSAAYSQDNALSAIGVNTLENFAGQFVPTLLGQVARTVDDTRRSTYIDRSSEIPDSWQKFGQKQANKIPGLSQQNVPYLNVWGEEDKTENPLMRAFENFISPGYIAKYEESDMTEELKRLNQAGYDNVLLNALDKYKSVDLDGDKEPERLDRDQWEAWQRTQGQTAKNALLEAIGGVEYQNMGDADRAEYVSTILDYSKSAGKLAAGGTEDTVDSWINKTRGLEENTGIGVSALLEARTKAKIYKGESSEEKTANYVDFVSYLAGKGYTQEQQDAISEAYYEPSERAEGYAAAVQSGKVSNELLKEFLSFSSSYNEDGEGALTQKEVAKALRDMDITNAERLALYATHGWKTSYSEALKKK